MALDPHITNPWPLTIKDCWGWARLDEINFQSCPKCLEKPICQICLLDPLVWKWSLLVYSRACWPNMRGWNLGCAASANLGAFLVQPSFDGVNLFASLPVRLLSPEPIILFFLKKPSFCPDRNVRQKPNDRHLEKLLGPMFYMIATPGSWIGVRGIDETMFVVNDKINQDWLHFSINYPDQVTERD